MSQRYANRRPPLSANKKKHIARVLAGSVLKKVTRSQLRAGTSELTEPEIGYIVAYMHQLGDKLLGPGGQRKKEFSDLVGHVLTAPH